MQLYGSSKLFALAIISIKNSLMKKIIGRLCQVIATQFTLQFFASFSVFAAISNLPPLLKPNVPANIFYTLDDSGSMQFEMMPDDIAATGDPMIDGGRHGYSSYISCPIESPCWVTHTFPRPPNVYNVLGFGDYARNQSLIVGFGHNITVARWRSSDVNAIYYDPKIRYLPWVSSVGVRMPNAVPAAALYNPVAPDGGENSAKINLTVSQFSGDVNVVWLNENATHFDTEHRTFFPALYYIYSDTKACTKSTLSCFRRVEIKPSTVFPAKGPGRLDCSGASCTVDQEMQNFANWFQYHRSRILVARSATGEAFSKQSINSRVGFGSINTIGGVVSHVSDDFGSASKANFLNALYRHRIPSSTTPLRKAIDDVGQYFRNKTVYGPWQTQYGIGDVSSQLSCRQNYHILMTDGYWNGSGAELGRSGDYDNSSAPTITGPMIGNTRASYSYVPKPPYADATAGTLADISFYYWSRDLRNDWGPEKKNVPTTAENPAFWQHLVQLTVGLGVNGSLDPVSSLPGLTSGDIQWPAATGASNQIDDLWHAALNSRGKYFSAKDPIQFASALESALETISARVSGAAALAKSSHVVRSGVSLFVSTYRTTDWSGQLQQKMVEPLTGKILPDQTLAWSASVPISGRKIFTWADSRGKIFNYANLDIDDQVIFASAASTYQNITALQLADYIAGGSDLNRFRVRTSPFGDFVNSVPQYLKEGEDEAYRFLPPQESKAGASYGEFLGAKKMRQEMIYVGANDGMLHAFNATSGVEEFAYIPKAVVKNLPALAQKNYLHQFYVDGTPTVADAYVNDAWRTLLLGTTGAGGRSVFVLDITNPAAFNASNVMWEINSANDTDIGYTIGKAQLGRAPNGDWIAVFGNGYQSESNRAILFIVNLANGAISKIDTGIGGKYAPNGLATPRLLIGPDATILAAYAGDLHGNLWKFNFDSAGAGIAYSGVPIFKASVAQVQQPITVQPELMAHPNGGVMILFGTGKIFEDTDATDTAKQSLYGIRDNYDVPNTSASPIAAGRAALQTQRLSLSNASFYDLKAKPIDWALQRGWVIDLDVSTGERLTLDPQLLYEQVIFTTTTPYNSQDPCVRSGSSTTFQLDAINGTPLTYQTIDTNNDGVVDANDTFTVGRQGPLVFGSAILEKGKKAIIYQLSSAGQSGSTDIDLVEINKIALPTIRLWRQILGRK